MLCFLLYRTFLGTVPAPPPPFVHQCNPRYPLYCTATTQRARRSVFCCGWMRCVCVCALVRSRAASVSLGLHFVRCTVCVLACVCVWLCCQLELLREQRKRGPSFHNTLYNLVVDGVKVSSQVLPRGLVLHPSTCPFLHRAASTFRAPSCTVHPAPFHPPPLHRTHTNAGYMPHRSPHTATPHTSPRTSARPAIVAQSSSPGIDCPLTSQAHF